MDNHPGGQQVGDIIAGLERLASLRQDGTLTDDEFVNLKHELMSSRRSSATLASETADAPFLVTQPPPRASSTVAPLSPSASLMESAAQGLAFKTDWESKLGGSLLQISHPEPIAASSEEDGAGGSALVCPSCDAVWELQPFEACLPEFTCRECGYRMATRVTAASPDFEWEQGGFVADEAVLESATQAVMNAGRHAASCPECGLGYDPDDYDSSSAEWSCARCHSRLR